MLRLLGLMDENVVSSRLNNGFFEMMMTQILGIIGWQAAGKFASGIRAGTECNCVGHVWTRKERRDGPLLDWPTI
jgi:hypothetical protein